MTVCNFVASIIRRYIGSNKLTTIKIVVLIRSILEYYPIDTDFKVDYKKLRYSFVFSLYYFTLTCFIIYFYFVKHFSHTIDPSKTIHFDFLSICLQQSLFNIAIAISPIVDRNNIDTTSKLLNSLLLINGKLNISNRYIDIDFYLKSISLFSYVAFTSAVFGEILSDIIQISMGLINMISFFRLFILFNFYVAVIKQSVLNLNLIRSRINEIASENYLKYLLYLKKIDDLATKAFSLHLLVITFNCFAIFAVHLHMALFMDFQQNPGIKLISFTFSILYAFHISFSLSYDSNRYKKQVTFIK